MYDIKSFLKYSIQRIQLKLVKEDEKKYIVK